MLPKNQISGAVIGGLQILLSPNWRR